MTGYQEIHKLYGRTSRKQLFPDADRSFLILAARNSAAAIATFHKYGHVIGDINPNNVVVSATSKVKLIDCDSFQIKSGSDLFRCEVGVPHFTPPELQGKQLDQIDRQPNHDNFGLALLGFHLLYMGRHPYAGRFANGTKDMPIERAIREFRYAYSSTASTKQMAPPPDTLGMDAIPQNIRRMFEGSFSQLGVHSGRPDAGLWLHSLQCLGENLHQCSHVNSHKYYKSLTYCPWCRSEQSSGVVFYIHFSSKVRKPPFDLEKIISDIGLVVRPDKAILPTQAFTITPKPYKVSANNYSFKEILRQLNHELNLRESALQVARKQFDTVNSQWNAHVSDKRFEKKLTALRCSIHATQVIE